MAAFYGSHFPHSTYRRVVETLEKPKMFLLPVMIRGIVTFIRLGCLQQCLGDFRMVELTIHQMGLLDTVPDVGLLPDPRRGEIERPLLEAMRTRSETTPRL
jgi:hypothetical protein